MKVALDTNVLAYAEGLGIPERQAAARELVAQVTQERALIPTQALGELFNVLIRKGGRSRDAARAAVAAWRGACETFDTSAEVMSRAVDLAVDHRIGIWDAVILAVASGAGCRLLLSEDMHHGFTWDGVTVVNPFAADPHPLLAAALAARPSRGPGGPPA